MSTFIFGALIGVSLMTTASVAVILHYKWQQSIKGENK